MLHTVIYYSFNNEFFLFFFFLSVGGEEVTRVDDGYERMEDDCGWGTGCEIHKELIKK